MGAYKANAVYSATETPTGSLWVDGRPIYRKVLTGNVTLAAGTNTIAHGITGISSLELVELTFSMRLSSTTRGATVVTAWHREAGGNWASPVGFDGTNLSVYASFAWGASAYTAVIEYVK